MMVSANNLHSYPPNLCVQWSFVFLLQGKTQSVYRYCQDFFHFLLFPQFSLITCNLPDLGLFMNFFSIYSFIKQTVLYMGEGLFFFWICFPSGSECLQGSHVVQTRLAGSFPQQLSLSSAACSLTLSAGGWDSFSSACSLIA